MLSILVIGVGKFGSHLCKNLMKYGDQVMIVDADESKVEDLADVVTSAKVGDCTDVKVLKLLGVNNFDMAIVCVEDNFQASLEITYQLSQIAEPGYRIISLASTEIQKRFLERNGATEVIFPDYEAAERLARSAADDRIFDYIKLADECGIYEVPPLDEWIGKTIIEANVRAKYDIMILGTIDTESKELSMMPSPDYVFNNKERLKVLAREDVLQKYLKKIKTKK